MKIKGKFFDLVTMEQEYKNIHKLYVIKKETFIDNGVYVEYY